MKEIAALEPHAMADEELSEALVERPPPRPASLRRLGGDGPAFATAPADADIERLLFDGGPPPRE
ncbi:MAG: hypothetical protein M3P34_04355 [Actinomycetota bacterium]|nr:hypothetical protein [Actinomycetota bacterium]